MSELELFPVQKDDKALEPLMNIETSFAELKTSFAELKTSFAELKKTIKDKLDENEQLKQELKILRALETAKWIISEERAMKRARTNSDE